MREFLKKLFFGKEETPEEPESETVEFVKIEGWLDRKTEDFYSDVNDKAEELLKTIKSKKGEAEELIDKLKTAELHNKNIPMRAIQIMEGNRKAFITSTHRFLDKMDFDKLNYKNWSEFFSLFEEEIEVLARANKKSYMVLQEFFANESNKIALKMKEIEDGIINTNKKIAGKDMAGFNKLLEKVEEIKHKTEYLENNEKDISGKKTELKKATDEQKQLQEKLKKLQGSSEYKKVKELISEKEKNLEQIKQSEKNLLNTFSQFDRALKKYSKISIEPVIALLYLKNPYKALMDDPNLKILNIISGLRTAVENGSLGLKDKQKEKTLNVIKDLDGRFFNDIFDQSKKIDDQNKELLKQIKSHSIMLDIDEMSYNLTHHEEKIETMKKDIEILEKNSEKYDIKQLKTGLKKEIESQLNISVEFE